MLDFRKGEGVESGQNECSTPKHTRKLGSENGDTPMLGASHSTVSRSHFFGTTNHEENYA